MISRAASRLGAAARRAAPRSTLNTSTLRGSSGLADIIGARDHSGLPALASAHCIVSAWQGAPADGRAARGAALDLSGAALDLSGWATEGDIIASWIDADAGSALPLWTVDFPDDDARAPDVRDGDDAPARGVVDAPGAGRAAPLYAIKRTFQPSLIRRKRKHGFLRRLGDRNGRKILKRRRLKGRRRLAM